MNLFSKQKKYFRTGESKDLDFRIEQLKKLKNVVLKHQNAIFDALEKDFKKPKFETYGTEIGLVLSELRHQIKNLKSWAKPKSIKTNLVNQPAKSKIYPVPYGVNLIIGAWNYPVQLILNPLLGAISAGNCAIIKPSEIASHSAKIIEKIIQETFDEKYIAVVQGGVETTQALLKLPFDHIFFTGSVAVGKIVMRAASENLTPITLELGGKSPCIVDETADIKLAAKRIIWGKMLNAGQTCVAPDYVLVHQNQAKKLIKALERAIFESYGFDPEKSSDFARIINQKHFERLKRFLKDGEIAVGGITNSETNYISPTVLKDISWKDSVMQEEIFGPILPVLTYENTNEIIEKINQLPAALTLYIFSKNKENQQKIIQNIDFGGGCINETVSQFANPHLPFGGFGSSGMGSYHGKASFEAFSHFKSILDKSNWVDVPLRYPPYDGKLALVKQILK